MSTGELGAQSYEGSLKCLQAVMGEIGVATRSDERGVRGIS